VHLHPQGGGKKFFRPNLQEKYISAPPRTQSASPARAREQESIFRTVFAGWLRFGGIFRRSLRATTKRLKKVVNFFGAKSAPQTKSWLRLCPLETILRAPMTAADDTTSKTPPVRLWIVSYNHCRMFLQVIHCNNSVTFLGFLRETSCLITKVLFKAARRISEAHYVLILPLSFFRHPTPSPG